MDGPERRVMRTFLVMMACVVTLSVLAGCSDEECDPCVPVVPVQPLAQMDAAMGGGSSMGTDTLWVYCVSSNSDTLFDLLVTEDDEGTVKMVDAGLYPEFANAAATLTDGVDDGWTFWVRLHPDGGGGGAGRSESTWLEGGLTGEYDPDLHGAEVSQILINLDYIYVDNQISWTDFSVEVRLVIMGRP